MLGLLAAGAVASVALTSVPLATAADGPPSTAADGAAVESLGSGRYVVLLREASATRYDGGTGALAPTRPAGAQPFKARSADVRAYEAHLRQQQRLLAASVGADIDQQYTLAANGFTARLTGKQATELASDRRVLMVTEDVAFDLDTWNTPDFLGLSGTDGAWNQKGGPAAAGDGVVVGVLDTGIWPESASFAGDQLTSEPTGTWGLSRNGDTITMRKADGGTFRGQCEAGDSWDASDCNSKLVGARYYPDTFLAVVPPEHRSPHEFISTRDGGGHGSHTASTAAGNNGVEATVEDRQFGAVSGMAPAAKIAAYKVCFADDDPDTGGCYTSSTLDAVDDAVADGVDVINFSISGARDTVVDAVEYAFAGAASAGVFVTASAGNNGPGASTVAHNSPWVTTVAASTHAVFENTIVLGNQTRINGASIASELPADSHRLVASAAVKRDGADAAKAALCYENTLDPTKVTGTVVVCDRGVIDRVAKSAEVARAGGVGMVLANVSPGSLDSDFHSVPTVHIDSTDTTVVKQYLETAGDSASIRFERGDTTGGPATLTPQVGGFSSRGPALASGSDVIKPDIIGPGVSVLAAVAPPSNHGRDFDLYSGTSMSTPHVAGLAAFMMGANPSWTPMTVKSAMMTTAYDVKAADGGKNADPFAQGAGHVDPTRFFDPGLVVTSNSKDWDRFYQGQGLDLGVEPLEATELNVPSIAQGQVTAATTLRRQFTALKTGTWQVKVDLPGFTAQHRPSLSFKTVGQTQRLEVTFTRTTAPLAKFSTGFVTLTGPTTVRIPVALRPVSVKAPATVRGTGSTGSATVPIAAGFTGDLTVAATGLAKARTEAGTLPVGKSAAFIFDLTGGAKLARYDLDAANDQADLDLSVYRLNAAGTALEARVGQSATGSADESVTLRNPRPAKYYVIVDGYAAAPGESSIAYRLDGFAVDGSATAGGLAVSPNPVPVVSGVETSFDATWSGLEEGSRYLGMLEYEGALSPTYLYVN